MDFRSISLTVPAENALKSEYRRYKKRRYDIAKGVYAVDAAENAVPQSNLGHE
jgi:hypothetical protein